MTQSIHLAAATAAGEVASARQAFTTQLDRWECTNMSDAELVFSELVTNAVTHAGGAIRIVAVHGEQTLRLEVHDNRHDIPTLLSPATIPGGFGMRIIGSLTSSWGWDQTALGKIVWANIPCCPSHND